MCLYLFCFNTVVNSFLFCFKLQNKAFQNYSAAHLHCPALGSIRKIETLHRQARICLVSRAIPRRAFAMKSEQKLFFTALPNLRMVLPSNEASINSVSLGRLGSQSFSHSPKVAVSDRINGQSVHEVNNKDVNLEISSLPASDKQSSITKGKVKRKSRSKKNSSESADGNEEAPQQRARTAKKRQSPAISEVSNISLRSIQILIVLMKYID